MLSYNNTTEQYIRDTYSQVITFPTDEVWKFYDEDASGNGAFDKILITYQKVDMGGGMFLDYFKEYRIYNNGNVTDAGGGDKQGVISDVLNGMTLHFTNQEFEDALTA